MVAQAVSAVALALLAASGVSKLLEPDPTMGAMRAMRIPTSRLLARGLGFAEMGSAVLGLALGGIWLAGAAVLYLGFFVFTLVAVRRELPLQSCGCFGREDTPPTWLHVGYNGLTWVALGYLTAVNGSPVPWQDPAQQVALYLAFTLIGTYLAYLVLAQLPRTLQMAGTR